MGTTGGGKPRDNNCKWGWGLLRESEGWGDGHCLVETESHDRELLLKVKQRENEWTIKDMAKYS